MDPVLRIEGLTKTFRTGFRRKPFRAVDQLSLEIEPGRVVAFVGPNGAGKSTTIYAALGLLLPDSGSLSLFGRSPRDPAARVRVGFQSEIFFSYPFLTARKALQFYGSLSDIPRSTLLPEIDRQLERLGLGGAADRKIGTFSKGMTQRLGLAQALLHRPELLILDEPTSGLDPEGRRLVARIIEEEKAAGTGVFLSSHILSDVERTCDHVLMIRQGRIVFSESIAALSQGSAEWEIEAAGWRPEHEAEVEAAGGRLAGINADGVASCLCPADRKRDVLRRLLDLPVEIGAVRRATRSLEDLYMQHVGEGSGE